MMQIYFGINMTAPVDLVGRGAEEVGIAYRDTSLIRNQPPVGPYRRPTPRVLGGSWGDGRFLMGEVSLHTAAVSHCSWLGV